MTASVWLRDITNARHLMVKQGLGCIFASSQQFSISTVSRSYHLSASCTRRKISTASTACHNQSTDQTARPLRSLAIITGGSRGLGYQIARHLLCSQDPSAGFAASCSGGHDVLLLARDPDRLADACRKLQQEASNSSAASISRPGRVFGYATDLGNLEVLKTTVLPKLRQCAAQGGWLPAEPSHYASVLLVHNAATTGDLAYSWDQTLDNIKREMDLNVVSPAAITSTVVSTFLKSPVCREILVVNISSVSVDKPYEAFGVYAAGKAARAMLTATLAREADLIHNTQQQPWKRHSGRLATHKQQEERHMQQGIQTRKHQAESYQQQQQHVQAQHHHHLQYGHSHSLQQQQEERVYQQQQQQQQQQEGARGNIHMQQGHGDEVSQSYPIIRSISYAPGALDTEMQACAREAIPVDAPLKAAFIDNMQQKRLLDPAESARYLIQLLQGPRSAWTNGQHVTVYELRAAQGHATSHPLDYQATG